MRRCSGNNLQEWGYEAIFAKTCPACGAELEFFKDEINKTCKGCGRRVANDRADQGCGQWCSSRSDHRRNLCPKFRLSKHRWRKR